MPHTRSFSHRAWGRQAADQAMRDGAAVGGSDETIRNGR